MNERIKQLRKALGLSQDEFGRRLGVTRGAITNIELNKTEPKPLFVGLLCREFNASYEWLTTGDGEMFEALPAVLLDEVAQQYNLDEMDKRILQSYLELPCEDRAAVKRYINKILGK